LESHFANKDFWTRVVFFVAGPGQLNKAHVQYLEAHLIAKARTAKRMPWDNGNMPTEPTLSEMDRAYMEVFLQNLLGMLPVLSITAFEQSPAPVLKDKPATLYCKGKGARATGNDTPQGFVVRAGSLANMAFTPSMSKHFPNTIKARADLVENGVLLLEGDKFRFVQDFTFSSPSLASAIVLGRPSNGRTDWKDVKGRTLKEIQEELAS